MKRNVGWWPSGMLAVALAAIAGCGPFAIDYRPLTNVGSPPAPAASVTLQVRNIRPDERGGLTARVGTIYDWSMQGVVSEYHPRAIDTTSSAIVSQTVEAATTDALGHAGILIQTSRPVLVASVKEYWFDGHPLHTTEIVVAYDLLDGNGRSLWHAEFRGDASATLLLGSALVNTFRSALQEMARQASDAFRSPAFQASLRSAS